jgi:hypothetical protein
VRRNIRGGKELPPPLHHPLLREAIERNAGIVLSLPSAGLLRHHKSRFLADAGDNGGDGLAGFHGFWVESVPAERPLVDELITGGRPIGISFRSGHNKVVLASPIRRWSPAYRINADTTVEALLLPYPDQVRATQQRRNDYRVRLPAGCALSARVWRIAKQARLADVPMDAQVAADLLDISLGGIGVTFGGEAGNPPKVSPEDRLRIELTYKETVLLLEARMRHPDVPTDSACRAGLEFKVLAADLDGRHLLAQLTRIVGELQREEIRRARRG